MMKKQKFNYASLILVLGFLLVVISAFSLNLASYKNAPNDGWIKRFQQRGVNDLVNAVAYDGSNLFVGGRFRGTPSELAQWDGNKWIDIPGIGGSVQDLEIYSGDLYCAAPVYFNGEWHEIVRRSGSSWYSVGGNKIHQAIYTIEATDDGIYAGGGFNKTWFSGNAPANGIARLNGADWDSLGSGIERVEGSPFVLAIAVSGDTVYAGGNFNIAGGQSISYIAMWDWGDSTWSAVGTGLSGEVRALEIYNDTLYAAGMFPVSKWDGSTWTELGGNETSNAYDLKISESGEIYVGGAFNKSIKKWNGSSWEDLGGGLVYDVRSIFIDGTDIYLGGWMTVGSNDKDNYTNYTLLNCVGKWNGSNWEGFGNSISTSHVSNSGSTVQALKNVGPDMYVGGIFSSAGAMNVSGIAKWDGSSWDSLATMVDNYSNILYPFIYSVDTMGTDIYVAGKFDFYNNYFGNIARFDGSGWQQLGGGIDSAAYALLNVNDTIYVGGEFVNAYNSEAPVGGVTVNHIAFWDGSGWGSMDNGFDGIVRAIATDGNAIYAGGEFIASGTDTLNGIARWNGSQWQPMGSGIENVNNWLNKAYAIAVDGNSVYIGGYFSNVGGVNVNNIAKWNGNSWEAMGEGLPGPVYSIKVYGSHVFAGSYMWDGQQWSQLGTGANSVFAFELMGDSLFVGGNFYKVGDEPGSKLAVWNADFIYAAPPTQLTASNIRPDSVRLAWQGETYEFSLFQGSTEIYTGTDTAFVVGGLSPGTEYTFKVHGKKESTLSTNAIYLILTTPAENDSNSISEVETIPSFFTSQDTTITSVNTNVAIQFPSGVTTATSIDITLYNGDPGVSGSLPAGVDNISRSINWTISPSTGASVGTYNITFDLTDVSGIQNFNALIILKRPDSSSPWVDVSTLPGVILNYNDPLIQINGLTSFSDFGVGSGAGDNSLPVELNSFSANAGDRLIKLKWQTRSELENSGFIIMRSKEEAGEYYELASYKQNEELQGLGTSSSGKAYSFIDKDISLVNGVTYYYKLIDVDYNGSRQEHGPVSATPIANSEPENGVVREFMLAQNYPNPFNPETLIRISLKEPEEHAEVSIYDIRGTLVRKLFSGPIPGYSKTLSWRGKNDYGKTVASGIYFYHYKSEKKSVIKQMVFLK